MPRGVKDWLAGKTPVLAKQRHTRKDRRKDKANNGEGGRSRTADKAKQAGGHKAGSSATDGEAKTKDQKRRDQQHALDRRTAAGAAVDAPTSTAKVSLQQFPPGVEANVEDLRHDHEKHEAKPGAADHAHSAEEARPVAAGEAWLGVGAIDHSRGLGFDSIDLAAEPKNTVLEVGGGGGARQQAPSWSFAKSGVAAMAGGEEWGMLDDEIADDEEGIHLDGGWTVAPSLKVVFWVPRKAPTHPTVGIRWNRLLYLQRDVTLQGIDLKASTLRLTTHPHCISLAFTTGGHLEAKGTPPRPEPSDAMPGPIGEEAHPAAISHPIPTTTEPGRARGRGRGRGLSLQGRFRQAAGPDDISGPRFTAARGKPVRGDVEIGIGFVGEGRWDEVGERSGSAAVGPEEDDDDQEEGAGPVVPSESDDGASESDVGK